MYEGNHNIDTPDNNWTDERIEELFIFCLLDRAMPYEKVCKSFEALKDRGMTGFHELMPTSTEQVANVLRNSGYRFYWQAAEYIFYNIERWKAKDLYDMSRDELVKNVKGFGYKLASMFYNRIHGFKYAIIDTHINKYLELEGCKGTSYTDKEKFFFECARILGISPEELDWNIWNENRVGNRR